MAEYIIKNIQFKETGDYEFCVTYSYGGILVTTAPIAREGATEDKIKSILLGSVELASQKRDDDNYEAVKTELDGKTTLTITG